ncbi:aldo/keto reductase [Micromonospora chalcea]
MGGGIVSERIRARSSFPYPHDLDNGGTMAGDIPLRVLGDTGISVPAVGMGCWAIGGPDHNLGMPMGWSTADDAESAAGLERAHALGARLFDTADVYGHGHSERLIGQLVAQVPRADLVLASKVGYFRGTAPHGFDPGHMRRQLEQSLENLRTDHLDIYFLHHSDFGPDDRWLRGAADTMRALRDEGLIRAIGMRGPHRFAAQRRAGGTAAREDKSATFRRVFDVVEPQILAVRDNLLTPSARSAPIISFAEQHGCGILLNKTLGQGLLVGVNDPAHPRVLGPGDHRSRKRWFTPAAGVVIGEGLARLRAIVGPDRADLVRVALWSGLLRSENAAVLVGFTRAAQVEMNLTCLGEPPPIDVIDAARAVMADVQRRLDNTGEVFLDERPPMSAVAPPVGATAPNP